MLIIDWILGALGIGLLLCAAFVFHRKRWNESPIRPLYYPFLVLKCFGTITYTFLYFGENASHSDLNTHFADISTLGHLLMEDVGRFWQIFSGNEGVSPDLIWSATHDQRSFQFIRLVFPIFLLSFRNVYFSGLFLTVLLTMAEFFFTEELYKKYPHKLLGILIGFLFWPSMLFWISGFSKETVSFLFLFLLLFVLIKSRNIITDGIIVILCVFGLYLIKPIYLPLAIPFVAEKLLKGNPKFKLYLLGLSGVAGVAFCIQYAEKLWLYTLISHQINYSSLFDISANELLMSRFDHLTLDLLTMLPNLPQAISSGLFRPFLVECSKPTHFLEAIQNTLMMAILLIFIARTRVNWPTWDSLYWSIFLVSVMLMVFISFSFPAIGTISRFKMLYLPWFIWLMLDNDWLIVFGKKTQEKILSKITR